MAKHPKDPANSSAYSEEKKEASYANDPSSPSKISLKISHNLCLQLVSREKTKKYGQSECSAPQSPTLMRPLVVSLTLTPLFA